MKYIAYVDGSYMKDTSLGEIYGAAALVQKEGDNTWACIKQASNDDMVSMHNVAGEIMAVTLLCEYAMKLPDCTDLVINYDYEGIEKWATGAWRAKNNWTRAYAGYIRTVVSKKINVSFNHIKGHTGNAGNEAADKFAKQAIEEYISARR